LISTVTTVNAGRRDEVLLQLSDLHFGADHTAVRIADRDVVLRSLVDSFADLDPDWTPSIVATTGDVGWAGRKTDYEAASAWFAEVAAALKIPRSDFVFVPGNHDVERTLARTLPRPGSLAAADQVFENGIPEHYQKPFKAYVDFCESFGARPFTLRGAPSYLVGGAEIRELRFVGINSCWFSQGDDDQKKLRLSLALMKLVEADAHLIQPRRWDARPITVALMHHPQNWLHDEETSYWSTHGEGSFLHLAARAHLLLCGHTHEAPRQHGRVTGGGIDLRCGASFAKAGHPNTYQLVRFRRNEIEYRQFELEDRPTDRRWRSSGVESARFSDSASDPDSEDERASRIHQAELRARLATYATQYLESKSRALSPDLQPRLQPLRVESRVVRDHKGRGPGPEFVERMPLEQAIADAPRLLVWGDLGTGKSTIVGMFAEKVNRDADATAVLIPAAHLVPIPSTGGELLQRASSFVRETLFADREVLDLREEILNSTSNTVLIVDGLDEIENKAARRILAALESLSESLPRLRVVATSRAVSREYQLGANWRGVTMASLLEEDRRALLIDVASAAGFSGDKAEAEATLVLRRIDADETLREAAQSPMALRLLYRELRSSTDDGHRTLGEMLHRLLDERLLHWEDADEKKGKPTQAFCDALPGVQGRRDLLALIAIAIHAEGPISIERAEFLIRSASVLNATSEVVKGQALKFFEWTNLIVIANGRVDFALRPLLEIACAPAVLDRLGRGDSVAAGQWRLVAFAAAIARQRGQIGDLRAALFAYILAHGETGGWFLAACYVTAEARDSGLALDVIGWCSQRPFERPLFAIDTERRTSAAAVAMTIHLAGDVGFEWFYGEYLNPRYPILHRASAILEAIFDHWVGLQGETVSPRKAALLTAFPPSHLATHSAALLRLVPLAVLAHPTSVPPSDRAWLIARLLTHGSLSARAERQLRTLAAAHPEEVQTALWRHIVVGYENAAKAAELWLDGAPSETVPPLEIISVALRSRGNWEGRYFSRSLWERLIERLGARFERFCRWHLSDPDVNAAVAAATHLISQRPAMATDVRDVLLTSLHDGNRNREAQPILAEVARNAPLETARWLARRIAESGDPSFGAHSSWWRLLLTQLEGLGEVGPMCLGAAIGGLGSFTLSRHADIRRLVRNLARSAQSTAYAAMLQQMLRQGSSKQRYGAAQLLICMGISLGEALVVCARARLELLHRGMEWDQYCLSLRFPAADIDHVLASKDTLPLEAKLFVLGLAVSDGRELEKKDLDFVSENATKLYALPVLVDVPFREAAFQRLQDLLFDARLESAASAAAALLQGHLSRLDPKTRLRCEMLALNASFLGRFREFEADVSRRTEVIECGRAMAREYGQMSVWAALAEASADPAKWKDAVRILIRNERMPSDNEVIAWDLLRIGREFPHHAAEIGTAARLVFDEGASGRGRPLGEGAWLILLAHEFGAIQTSELREVVNPYKPEVHLSSIYAALAARITDEQPRPEHGEIPAPSITPASLDDVVEAERDEGSAKLCEVIPRTLYRHHAASHFESLAARGERPRLVAAILQYLNDTELESAWVGRVVGSNVFRARSESKCDGRLRDLVLQAFRRLAREQPDATRALLRNEMVKGGIGCLDAAILVASIGGSLTADELAAVALHYGASRYLGWRPLLRIVIAESVRLLDALRTHEAFRRAVSQTIELMAADEKNDRRDPLAMVAYACLAWLLDVQSSDADSAFRHGVGALGRADDEQVSGMDALAESVELLKRVDPQRIRGALTGHDDEETELVAIALLLASFFPK
jgi:predicted MPP superfamily phosphohydrolase